MVRGLAVVLGGNGAGLLVRIADKLNFRAAGERIVEVHSTAAGHQENVFHALAGDEAHDIIGELHYGLPLAASWGAERTSRIESIRSRTAPLPPGRAATNCAFTRTSGRASAGAAARPAIPSAPRSLTSSPIKQTSSNSRPCCLVNRRRASALSLQLDRKSTRLNSSHMSI